MKLTYRGVSYPYTPTQRLPSDPIVALGIYRGVLMPFRSTVDIPEQFRFTLTWRGIPYRREAQQEWGQVSANMRVDEAAFATPSTVRQEGMTAAIKTPAAAPKVSVIEQARNLAVQHHQKTRQREQSMLVRLNEDVGLPSEDAAHYESHIQGKIPHDFSGYDRSAAAMS
ncbi:MAG: DUF4278 domain-containing protein [Cyanobacteria bacterium P01_E01_bin.6]